MTNPRLNPQPHALPRPLLVITETAEANSSPSQPRRSLTFETTADGSLTSETPLKYFLEDDTNEALFDHLLRTEENGLKAITDGHSQEAQRTNEITYHLNMAGQLLDLAANYAHVRKTGQLPDDLMHSDVPEASIARHEGYERCERTINQSLITMADYLEATRQAKAAKRAKWEEYIKPQPITPVDVAVACATIQTNMDMLEQIVSTELKPLPTGAEHEVITRECLQHALTFITEAKERAALWQKDIEASQDRGLSGGKTGGI